jgi:signal transduction histidine kinase
MWETLIGWFGSHLWEPHGHCFLWTPSLLWTMVSSNLLIAIAYYSIPVALLTLVRKREDLVHKPIFILFAIFIFSCGTTHLVKVWTLWEPVYWLQGAMDAITAGASILTAVILWPLLPRIVTLPSPAQLRATNAALQAEIAERKQIEAELAEMHRKLSQHQEAERLRLAQELHDEPLQELYAVQFQLHDLTPAFPDAEQQAKLASLKANINQVGEMLRAICSDLRPPALEEIGLAAAIESFVGQFQSTQPAVTFELDLTPVQLNLPPWTSLALLRILQQALRNIARHAAASHVWIRLSVESRHVVLEIRDNGRGFVVPQRWVELVRQGHFGVAGMVERAEGIGGRFSLESTPGQGTAVRVAAPHNGDGSRDTIEWPPQVASA